MIPLYDNIPARRTPLMTYALIALNVIAFIHEIRLGPGLEDFVLEWGFVPARFFLWRQSGYAAALDPLRFLPLLTGMFLHAGVLHIAGNMLFLHIFGDNVEDRLGRVGFLCAYLACGVFAALAQGVAAWGTPAAGVPMVGASGAIAGVLGTYLVLHPRARVVTLVPIIVIPLFVEIPALVFLGVWFLIQLANGWMSLGARTDAGGGVAFVAHVAGFVAGGALGLARRIADAARR